MRGASFRTAGWLIEQPMPTLCVAAGISADARKRSFGASLSACPSRLGSLSALAFVSIVLRVRPIAPRVHQPHRLQNSAGLGYIPPAATEGLRIGRCVGLPDFETDLWPARLRTATVDLRFGRPITMAP